MREGTTIVAVAVACGALAAACHGTEQPNTSQTPPKKIESRCVAAAATPAPTTDAGSASCENVAFDAETFYHLSEGSDLIPLSWLRALESSVTHKSFMEGLDRFGLIPDPASPDKLPIGMTADTSVDGTFGATKLVGFNCAACHLGRVEGTGSMLLLGAPNMFDIEGFYDELFESIKATVFDVGKLYAFVRSVLAAEEPTHTLRADAFGIGPTTDEGLKAFCGRLPVQYDSLDREPEQGAALQRQLSKIQKAEIATPEPDPVQLFLSKGRTSGKKELGAWSAELAPSTSALALRPRGFAERFAYILHILRSRLKLLAAVATGPGGAVAPGPGRVDAFGMARNLMFPSFAHAADAPVSYPYLWGFGGLTWLHWDANTTSIMERNVGQAIGLGAILDAASGDSTVRASNIHELECMARTITPPKWDSAVLGSIDTKLAARGQAIYEARCKGCHEPGDREYDVGCIGTDAARATGFARRLGPDAFSEKLEETLGKAEDRAFDRESVAPATRALWAGTGTWRTTNRYPARRLSSVWATAPYLHDGSVPTIWDLLSESRPAKFRVGQRKYDSKHLGYAQDATPEAKDFDTSVDGNRNVGHMGPEYGTINLEDSDKWALIEFLKTF